MTIKFKTPREHNRGGDMNTQPEPKEDSEIIEVLKKFINPMKTLSKSVSRLADFYKSIRDVVAALREILARLDAIERTLDDTRDQVEEIGQSLEVIRFETVRDNLRKAG